MNRRIRLCATVGFAAVLGLGMLPATASASGEASNGQATPNHAQLSQPRWEAIAVYDDGNACDSDGNAGEAAGTYLRSQCNEVHQGIGDAYVLWVVFS